MNRIAELRKNKELTQPQLAEMIGSNKSYVSQMETGARILETANRQTQRSFADALGCSIPELFTEIEFRADGRLIIDDIKSLSSVSASYLLTINGHGFVISSVDMRNNHDGSRIDLSKLIPTLSHNIPVYNDSDIIGYAIYNISPRNCKTFIKIGRAISEDELNDIKAKYDISDISEKYVQSVGAIYGINCVRTYTCIQFKIDEENAIEAETYLTKKGIEASNIAPGILQVKIKE